MGNSRINSIEPIWWFFNPSEFTIPLEGLSPDSFSRRDLPGPADGIYLLKHGRLNYVSSPGRIRKDLSSTEIK